MQSVLLGVEAATRCGPATEEDVSRWISSKRLGRYDTMDMEDWLAWADQKLEEQSQSWLVARLVVAVAFLCKTDIHKDVQPQQMDRVWEIVYDAIMDSSLEELSISAVPCDENGYYQLMLYSFLGAGRRQETLQLRVRLPSKSGPLTEQRYTSSVTAYNWVLAGEVTDVSQSRDRGGYRSSNTVRYGRNSTYSEDRRERHSFAVGPGVIHAVLSFSDASPARVRSPPPVALDLTRPWHDNLPACQGMVADLLKATSLTSSNSLFMYNNVSSMVGCVTASALGLVVDVLRSFEECLTECRDHAIVWSRVMRRLNDISERCDSMATVCSPSWYKCLILAEKGCVYRHLGHYRSAEEKLVLAANYMRDSFYDAGKQEYVHVLGELGVVLWLQGRLAEAKRNLQRQYDLAREHGLEREACRAIGNLGMVNYHLAQQEEEDERAQQGLLSTAIRQLWDRVERARALREEEREMRRGGCGGRGAFSCQVAKIIHWESIGLQRLSLCYDAAGNLAKSVQSAREGFQVANTTANPRSTALAFFFLGRALMRSGKRAEGLEYMVGSELPLETCTPLIALCKEPSEEHSKYLLELLDAVHDEGDQYVLDFQVDATDENGYSALEYCRSVGDSKAETIIVSLVCRQLYTRAGKDITSIDGEAERLLGYCTLFQDWLRKDLLSMSSKQRKWSYDEEVIMQDLRENYDAWIEHLSEDESHHSIFDVLKFIPYHKFAAFGCIPKSDDNVARPYFQSRNRRDQEPYYLIFISYRWMGNSQGASPDDDDDTQYNRMVTAVEQFLQSHPDINRRRVGLWVDYACIDQSDKMPGVAALPFFIMQCNAIISLVDESYYDRGWCSMEVMIVQNLRQMLRSPLWYEHVPADSESYDSDDWSFLRDGPLKKSMVMDKKKFSDPLDRPRVLFLERQVKLLHRLSKAR